jgi:riboflavin kinase/FMN adenylyltransferase
MSGSEPHIVAVGVFDGVHRGHLRILAKAREDARRAGVGCAVVTFEPHPDAVLGKSVPLAPLTPVGEKRELLTAAGADRVEILHFDHAMAALEPEEFVRHRLIEPLGMVRLVAGEDFALGRARRGDIAYLRELGALWGFSVDAVPLLLDPDGPVSSSRIRAALAEGRMEDAARALGRPFRLEAQVVRGQGLGGDLGFPTANLELLEHQAVPADGIYAVWVTLPDGARRGGAMYIGKRPTVGDVPHAMEVYLLDFEGELMGQPLVVDFAAWLREERRFANLAARGAAWAEAVRLPGVGGAAAGLPPDPPQGRK